PRHLRQHQLRRFRDRLPQAPGRPAQRCAGCAQLLRCRLLHRQRDPAQALMTHPADADLLPRLLAGEQGAFRQLIGAYQSAMRAVAYAIVGQRYADEVVQDAWLAVVRNLDGFQQRSSLKTWLLTIVANAARSRLKQYRREVLLDDLPAPHGTVGDARFAEDGHWAARVPAWHEDSPEALLTEDELRECLGKTLPSLAEVQRGVLLTR